MQAKASATGISQDLLIVGPGVLGGYAGKLWRESFPSSRVVAQTNTDGSHERHVADLRCRLAALLKAAAAICGSGACLGVTQRHLNALNGYLIPLADCES